MLVNHQRVMRNSCAAPCFMFRHAIGQTAGIKKKFAIARIKHEIQFIGVAMMPAVLAIIEYGAHGVACAAAAQHCQSNIRERYALARHYSRGVGRANGCKRRVLEIISAPFVNGFMVEQTALIAIVENRERAVWPCQRNRAEP